MDLHPTFQNKKKPALTGRFFYDVILPLLPFNNKLFGFFDFTVNQYGVEVKSFA